MYYANLSVRPVSTRTGISRLISRLRPLGTAAVFGHVLRLPPPQSFISDIGYSNIKQNKMCQFLSFSFHPRYEL